MRSFRVIVELHRWLTLLRNASPSGSEDDAERPEFRAKSWHSADVTALIKCSKWRNNNIQDHFRIKDIINKYTETREELLALEVQVETFRIKMNYSKVYHQQALNPLGALVEVITINLDNNDAIRCERQTNGLKNKVHSVELNFPVMQNSLS